MTAPGLDVTWSRTVEAAGHTWHYLDNVADLDRPPRGTLLCVHGNPTWSYLWRSLLSAGTRAGWRVVAVDQLGMGYSDRPPQPLRLADRIRCLGAFTDAVGLSGAQATGPVVTVGHDWGGIVSLGWAVDHPEQLAGVVLTNTAVHHDPADAVPALLRLARHGAVHAWGTERTTLFLDVALGLARPPLPPDVRAAYRAPYRTPEQRRSIAQFVADIPVDADHPSHSELARVADGIGALEVPALLLWGTKDPVFTERYLRDLLTRLPHADVHRFTDAGHLVVEDVDVAGTVTRWLDARRVAAPDAPAADGQAGDGPASNGPAGDDAAGGAGADASPPRARRTADTYEPLWTALAGRATSTDPAIVALGPQGTTALSWTELATRVEHLALGLADAGVRPGHRVVLLVPPGPDLTTALFACLRIGAVIVLADAGLGTAGLTRAVRGAGADVVIGIDRAMAGARLLRWPGRRVLADGLDRPAPAALRAALRPETTLRELLGYGAERAHQGARLPEPPGPEDDAAVLFTSGSTGPAKGVVYTHRGLAAMRDAVAATYGLGPSRGLVAGFAPFALLGTALGATSATPDMDVTAPATLTAAALADAVAAIGAEAVFTSPSALANAVRTADALTSDQRASLARVELFLSAGAPIAPERLAEATGLMPFAQAHTPYGMTEVLPVTDVSLTEIGQAAVDAGTGVPGAGGGTCVGRPVPGARVRVVPLDAAGRATGEPTEEPAVTGEILVAAPHLKDRYDRLWATQAHSATWPGWHRTGDVGHLDAAGRLWVEGRLSHVITTAEGVLTPVAVETAAQQVRGVQRAGAVGVGPTGVQQLVVVVETDPARDPHAGARPGVATPGLARLVRTAVGRPVAAVLRVPELPTDVRHNAKVDRTRLARWAEDLLAGRRAGTP